MAQARLEFRGITLDTHREYLAELGFRPCPASSDSPFERYCRDDGARIIVRETRMLKLTAEWSIDVVVLDFEAPDAERLDAVLSAYRVKTMRAGG
ncbi:hypothetical protein [Hydrogenibacillus sp. N12]|uniref:hypothetical protein n=1 Tax=Hydrogenibacillus sp. N12 TaxID=2866627 RepID=UPI001C7CEF7E|nr:hypothetical protein [Hydrogenibacillus sp. N12]QZA33850.1 hypothetical protein K2M58_04895 [Hydrogenibacillus sp. N12]